MQFDYNDLSPRAKFTLAHYWGFLKNKKLPAQYIALFSIPFVAFIACTTVFFAMTFHIRGVFLLLYVIVPASFIAAYALNTRQLEKMNADLSRYLENEENHPYIAHQWKKIQQIYYVSGLGASILLIIIAFR